MKPPWLTSVMSLVQLHAPWLLLNLFLLVVSAPAARAQDPGAETPTEGRPRGELPAKESKEPFLKRDGQVADNQQWGGEPGLTEVDTPPAGAVEPEDCDLDCVEARLAAEEKGDRRSKGTLELAREMEIDTTGDAFDPGDALEAEPSTTDTPETEADVPGDRSLPTRLGPVRIAVGKTSDWIAVGLATQMEFEYAQEFRTGGFPRESEEVLEFRRIRLTLSSSFIDGRIRSRFQINLTPSAFELIDLWFAFTRFKFATFRVGQFKIPYDRYRAQSFAALSLIDWEKKASKSEQAGEDGDIGADTVEPEPGPP